MNNKLSLEKQTVELLDNNVMGGVGTLQSHTECACPQETLHGKECIIVIEPIPRPCLTYVTGSCAETEKTLRNCLNEVYSLKNCEITGQD